MLPQARRHYRVSGTALDETTVVMHVGGRFERVTLLDISVAGAGIALPLVAAGDPRAQPIQRGSRVELIIRNPGLQAPLVIEAAVARRVDRTLGVVLGLAFHNRADEVAQLDKTLLRLFNRRAAVRVDADPDDPTVVTLYDRNGRPRWRALLLDLSVHGFGLAVRPQDVDEIRGHSPSGLMLSVRLGETDVSVTGQVRFLGLMPVDLPGADRSCTMGRVGVELRPVDRARPDVRRALTETIMGRQRALIRAQKQRREGIPIRCMAS